MEEECVILAKTYPQPSVKYRETTCVAAITDQRQFRRLFPVPFRFLSGDQQFKMGTHPVPCAAGTLR
ncbi:MAG: hypothetical protein JWM59_3160 [Verrucomicrobiales bacterium]|nr:hypothetical protein [Verrucomicrobiales bacterium]